MKKEGRRILMVSSTRKELWPPAVILTRLGHVVHLAQGGRDAIRKLERKKFDLLVLVEPLGDIPAERFLEKTGVEKSGQILLFARNLNSANKRLFGKVREIQGFPSEPVRMAALICECLMGWTWDTGTPNFERWVH